MYRVGYNDITAEALSLFENELVELAAAVDRDRDDSDQKSGT
jgi:hypothetical protein